MFLFLYLYPGLATSAILRFLTLSRTSSDSNDDVSLLMRADATNLVMFSS